MLGSPTVVTVALYSPVTQTAVAGAVCKKHRKKGKKRKYEEGDTVARMHS